MWFYPLDKKTFEAVQTDLKVKREEK